MSDLTPKQRKVFEAAKARLEKESWFRGVCCDRFPSDQEIDKDFNEAVTHVIMETEWWDAWDQDGFIPLRQAVEQEKKEQIVSDLTNNKKISQED